MKAPDHQSGMSSSTDEQLVEIVRIDTAGYLPEAIEAARSELARRQIGPSRAAGIEAELREDRAESTRRAARLSIICRAVLQWMFLGVLFSIAALMPFFAPLLFSCVWVSMDSAIRLRRLKWGWAAGAVVFCLFFGQFSGSLSNLNAYGPFDAYVIGQFAAIHIFYLVLYYSENWR
ncbi:MAG: hypothetical protein FJ276_25430 [Planctomycetes bacterium]|nr:hypothetical protein [Planctomycetota bacterium]